MRLLLDTHILIWRVEGDDRTVRGLLENPANEVPLAPLHASVLESLPLHHRDPYDRMLVAQALAEGLVLVTVDERVRQYDVPVFPPRRPRG